MDYTIIHEIGHYSPDRLKNSTKILAIDYGIRLSDFELFKALNQPKTNK